MRLFPGSKCAELRRSGYGQTVIIFYNELNQIHNDCGPAIIFANGSVQYYYEGKLINSFAQRYDPQRYQSINKLIEQFK